MARFDAGSYVTLTEAINGHDVGRGRGGTPHALRRAELPALVAGVDSDRLYPPAQQELLAELLPGADGRVPSSRPAGTTGSSSRRSRWARSYGSCWRGRRGPGAVPAPSSPSPHIT
ncbi:Homoserine O-acetyltransferase [Streptomyces californicus]